MPNVLDAEPVRAYARRIAGDISHAKVAARYERLVFDDLLRRPINFRPALPGELEDAPAWAHAAQARGETVSVFTAKRSSSRRLRSAALAIERTCTVAAIDVEAHPRDRPHIVAAREFLDKLDRADFETAARKAMRFSRLLETWTEDRDTEPVCAAQCVRARQGRLWRRVTSIGELRAVGREFRNCLARTTRSGSYGGMLRDGLAQFWVLRDGADTGRIVAMAPAPTANSFMEVRGPRNAPIALDDPDLMRLAAAIGIQPKAPPPPPPPADAAALARPLRRRLPHLEAALTRMAG